MFFSKCTRLTNIFLQVNLKAKNLFLSEFFRVEKTGVPNYCPIIRVVQGYQSGTPLISSLETITRIFMLKNSRILQFKVHVAFAWTIVKISSIHVVLVDWKHVGALIRLSKLKQLIKESRFEFSLVKLKSPYKIRLLKWELNLEIYWCCLENTASFD